jgi:hypothetical protein
VRLAEVDSERAASANNPTGASREGSGWSGPSKQSPACCCLYGGATRPTNVVGGAFKLLLQGLGVNDPPTLLVGFLGQW